MSKSVLISIQPKWCELIASGKKTVEVRKSKPTLDVPFKVYIYCSKSKSQFLQSRSNMRFYCENKDTLGGHGPGLYKRLNGTVIGEFVCDKIYKYTADPFISKHIKKQCEISDEDMVKQSCLSLDELYHYESHPESHSFGVFAWHISDLKIYDKPKELSEFYRKCDEGCEACAFWKKMRVNKDEYDMDCSSPIYEHIPITRPPQSWCYVEDMEVVKE